MSVSSSLLQSQIPVPRLRSTAKYTLFNPSALATTQTHNQESSSIPSWSASTSLAAISSKTHAAIILFHLGRPYEPTLVYHSTYNQCSKLNLQFSPDSKNLAASYDSSVFIYDCTGESLQPLLTRISSGSRRELIHDIQWKVSSSSSSESHSQHNGYSACHDFITCTDHMVAQWDLRICKKPALSFYGDGFVSVACDQNQIGTISTSGIVTVYDIRKHMASSNVMEKEESSKGTLYKYAAHSIGVGIDKLCHNWITWGMEEEENTVVRIWSQNAVKRQSRSENYWFMDGSGHGIVDGITSKNDFENPSRTQANNNIGTPEECHIACLAQVEVEKLTTVRVVSHGDTETHPHEKNGFITVSCPSKSARGGGVIGTQNLWQADLWALPNVSNNMDVQVECLATFQCGGSEDCSISEMIGKEYLDGHLIAAEISCLGNDAMAVRGNEQSESSKGGTGEECELILCSLTSNGYLTTHAIPEALKLRGSNVQDHGVKKSSPFRFQVVDHPSNAETTAKIFGDNDEGNRDRTPTMNNLRLNSTRKQSDMDVYNAKPTNVIDLGSIEGGVMQFDLDDDFDKEKANMKDTQDSKEDITTSDMLDRVIKSDSPLESIDIVAAKSVPSPRPCGALFGIDGSIICFHNGNLKNMWKWYKAGFQVPSSTTQADATRTSPPSTLLCMRGDVSDIEDDDYADNITTYPRSVWDLMKMNESAKVAQWGKERDDDDTGDSNESSSASDDEPSESSGTEEESIDSGSDESYVGISANDMYETYFGKMFDFKVHIEGPKKNHKNRDKKQLNHSPESLVPATENLEPKVFLSIKNKDMVMNGQCPELTEKWMLGPWQDHAEFHKVKNAYLTLELTNTEDGNLKGLGAVSVDQQRRDTMVGNLQKLYYQDTKKSTLSSVPLDQRVMQKKENRKLINQETMENMSHSSQSSRPRIETIAASSVLRPDTTAINMLKHKVDICIHNAKCAAAIGQPDKADVWNMLAEIINSVSGNFFDDFDGWHSMNGSALGRELIGNILRYYEMNGDCQMLATIVTVFDVRNCDRKSRSKSYPTSLFDLLLPYDSRYDVYIDVYSQLLYCWGKLITRAELNKHSSHRVVNFDSGIISRSGQRNKDIFVPCCQRCNRAANPETNICQHCHEYAFRCSICTNAIRGLYTVCISCGHGGHVNHIMPWFRERSVCPTGCGCTCTLITQNSHEGIDSSSSLAQKTGNTSSKNSIPK